MFTVPGQPATGDDAVNMEVLSEVLTPGVQDHDDAQFGPEVLGVTSLPISFMIKNNRIGRHFPFLYPESRNCDKCTHEESTGYGNDRG